MRLDQSKSPAVASPAIGVREAVTSSLHLLTPRDRRKYWLAVFIQMCLSLLDLFGVVLVGLVGILAATGLNPQARPPSAAEQAIEWFGLASVSPTQLAIYLALVAASFFVTKSVLSVILIRRVLRFLAGREAQVASRLTGELFAQPLTHVQSRSSQQTAYALLEGTIFATLVLLGNLALALSDVALLLLLTVTLFILDPIVTLMAIALFAAIAVVLQKVLGARAREAGGVSQAVGIEGISVVQEGMTAYREITVGNRRSTYRERISNVMWRGAGAHAELQFIAQVPKYILETALVVGAVGLVAAQAGINNPTAAIGTMTLFLAAGARVMPSILRLQVSLINIRNAEARARPTYELQAELEGTTTTVVDFDIAAFERGVRNAHEGFSPTVHLDAVSYAYPGSPREAVTGITLHVSAGESVALVGTTGAGKSTLADLILGILEPTAGTVRVGGNRATEALTRWPGAISYVPQSVALLTGTIRQNVALGIPKNDIDDDRVWEALEHARLATFLMEAREGLDTAVGEHGVRLSGGQRQRLGIARALYSRPALLVLDEATSALDSETEAAITAMLNDLAGTVTTVTIAHRLATVRSADVVVYLDGGCVAAKGGFDDVRRQQPAFDRQARLLGL